MQVERFHKQIAENHGLSEEHAKMLVEHVTRKTVHSSAEAKKDYFLAADKDNVDAFVKSFSHAPWAVGAIKHSSFFEDSLERIKKLLKLERQLSWLSERFTLGRQHCFLPSGNVGEDGPFRLKVATKNDPKEESIGLDFDLHDADNHRVFTLRGIAVGDVAKAKQIVDAVSKQDNKIKTREEAIAKIVEHVIPKLQKHIEKNQLKFEMELPVD